MLAVTYHSVDELKYTTVKMKTMMTTAPTMINDNTTKQKQLPVPMCFHNMQRDNFTSLSNDVLVGFCNIE